MVKIKQLLSWRERG